MKLLLSSGVLPLPLFLPSATLRFLRWFSCLFPATFTVLFQFVATLTLEKIWKHTKSVKKWLGNAFQLQLQPPLIHLFPSPPSHAHAKQAKRSSCEFSRARKRLAAVYGCKRAPQGAAANRQLVTAIRVASVFIFRKYWHSLRLTPLPPPARMLEI